MHMLPRNAEEPESVKRIDDAKNLDLTIVVEKENAPTSYFRHEEGSMWAEEMELHHRRFVGVMPERIVRYCMEREGSEYRLVDES